LVGTPCLLPKSLERQATCQPHQILRHRFEPCHQGPGFFELILSRVIFQVRRYITCNRGKREQQRTELVGGLSQPRRVPVPQGVSHFGQLGRRMGLEILAHAAQSLRIVTAGRQHGDRVSGNYIRGTAFATNM
jgi:hypothetical protein